MHDIKVIWDVPDNEIHVLSHFAYSKAPLKSQFAPGAFLKSRNCSKNHQNSWRSLKIALTSICAAPFSFMDVSVTLFDFLALVWPGRHSSTSLNVCAPNKSLWRLLNSVKCKKKTSKIPKFVNKSPIFVNHTKHRRLLFVSVLLRRRGASGASKRLWVKYRRLGAYEGAQEATGAFWKLEECLKWV